MTMKKDNKFKLSDSICALQRCLWIVARHVSLYFLPCNILFYHFTFPGFPFILISYYKSCVNLVHWKLRLPGLEPRFLDFLGNMLSTTLLVPRQKFSHLYIPCLQKLHKKLLKTLLLGLDGHGLWLNLF